MTIPEGTTPPLEPLVTTLPHIIGSDANAPVIPDKLPTLKRSDIFLHTVKANFKLAQNILLEPFKKLFKGEDLSWGDVLVLLLVPASILNPIAPFAAIIGAGAAIVGHALWYTAIGKMPEGRSEPQIYGKL